MIIISIILLRFGYNGYLRCSAIQSKCHIEENATEYVEIETKTTIKKKMIKYYDKKKKMGDLSRL